MVQLVETGTQERMLGIRLRFAKPSSYRFKNQMEGQRNNAGHQFDEVSSLIEIAITYMDTDAHVAERGPKVHVPRELEPGEWGP